MDITVTSLGFTVKESQILFEISHTAKLFMNIRVHTSYTSQNWFSEHKGTFEIEFLENTLSLNSS